MASIQPKTCTDGTGEEFVIRPAYQKLGFTEEGGWIRDIKRVPEDYVDTVVMYRFVK